MQEQAPNGFLFGGLSDLLVIFCKQNNIPVPEKLEKIIGLERFEFQTWREILTYLDQTLHTPALGLEIAKYIQTRHLGIIGYLGLSSGTLAEAIQRYYDFHRLVYDGNPLVIEAENTSIWIGWDFPKILTTQVTDEIDIALMYQFLKQFLHIDDIELEILHFQHSAPKTVFIYEQYFRCKVFFGQPKTRIKISANMLGKPIKHADSTLQNLLLEQAQKLLSELPNFTQLDERLQSAILVGVQQNAYSIEDICSKLNISVRQLQRHLQEQNSTFQHRVQQVRHMLAQQYLSDPYLSLQEIALLLGYSEQSAFQRAFKQWTGYTPKNWRKYQISDNS